jgi:hypothetical protein
MIPNDKADRVSLDAIARHSAGSNRTTGSGERGAFREHRFGNPNAGPASARSASASKETRRADRDAADDSKGRTVSVCSGIDLAPSAGADWPGAQILVQLSDGITRLANEFAATAGR